MDAGLGGLLQFKSTPTFFINGRSSSAAGSVRGLFDALIMALDQESARHIVVDAIRDTHRGTHQALRGRVLAPAALSRARRLTLDVESGEVFGFLGPNGAGKTTTLKLLMQLIYPTSGRAEILGRPVGDVGVQAPHRLPARKTRTSTTT